MLIAALALTLQAQPQLSEATIARVMAVSRCGSVEAQRRVRDGGSTEAIADAVLATCAAEDAALADQVRADFGADAPRQLAAMRSAHRRSLINWLAEHRGERAAAAPDSVGLWGRCIGTAASARLHDGLDRAALAAAALDACRAEQEVAHQAIRRQFGTQAEAVFQASLDSVPLLIARILDAAAP